MNVTRLLASTVVCACLLGVAGCSQSTSSSSPIRPASSKSGNGTLKKSAAAPAPKEGTASKPDTKVTVTPVTGVSGKVASFHSAGQFVVITFQSVQMPATDQRLAVYRNNQKVGEVKISKEQSPPNAVADIVAGTAQVGDEIRPENKEN